MNYTNDQVALNESQQTPAKKNYKNIIFRVSLIKGKVLTEKFLL